MRIKPPQHMQALEFLRDEVMIRVTTYRNWTIFPELTQCAFCEVFDALEEVQVSGKLARLETISGDPRSIHVLAPHANIQTVRI